MGGTYNAKLFNGRNLIKITHSRTLNTSIVNTSLLNENRYQDGVKYAELLAKGDSEKVISYESRS